MMIMKVLMVVTVLMSPVAATAAAAQDTTTSTSASSQSCPTEPITVAGADSVQRLTAAWKRAFVTFQNCPGARIENAAGGSFAGAARVCGTHQHLVAVDIGGMARRFNYGDATTENGWQFQCQRSPRKAIELSVAQEGIAMVTASGSGAAADCIRKLGGGLSLDQLRWMYTSYARQELLDDYWDAQSVPFDDGRDDTHLWSELHPDCAPVEIMLAGLNQDDPSYHLFLDVVLPGRDEAFALNRTVATGVTDVSMGTSSNSSNNSTTTTTTSTTRSKTLLDFISNDSNSTNTVSNDSDDGSSSGDGGAAPVWSFYSTSSVQDLAAYLQANDAAISYVSLAHLFSTKLRSSTDALSTISILSQEEKQHFYQYQAAPAAEEAVFIDPKAAAFDSSAAYPLSRTLYLYILDDPVSLANMAPFLEFALSEQGTEILKTAGFWPMNDWERIVMATRAQVEGGIAMSKIESSCGKDGDNKISMAGSTTVEPISRIWSEMYKLGCPHVETKLEGGGSSIGAGRVCANPDKGSPVDIGNMSRGWKPTEATQGQRQDFTYDCVKGDTSRTIVQVDVAQDGVTVIMQNGGTADGCVTILGGLTLDQLRWMYSNYNDGELEKTGWDPKSLKNSDNDSTTHLWSELDSRCPQAEIRLTGDILGDGTYTSFVKTVLADYKNGEDIDLDRPYGYRQGEGVALASFLRQFGDAVSYTGFNYYFDNQDSLSAAPIQNNAGVYVSPSETTISDGTYNPFVRKIWMNLLNEKSSLRDTVPMIKFGFSHPELVAVTGYVPLTASDAEEMINRLDRALHGDWSGEEDKRASLGLIFGVVAGAVAVISGLVLFLFFMKRGAEDKEDGSSNGEMMVMV